MSAHGSSAYRARVGSRDLRSGWREAVGVSRPTVWRWQQRFAEAGVEGLLRDKTRKPRQGADRGGRRHGSGSPTCTQPPRTRRPARPAEGWPRRQGFRRARCSASGSRASCSRIASTPSSGRAIPGIAAKLTDIVFIRGCRSSLGATTP